MLGLEAPGAAEVTRLAWDAAAVLGAWVELIEPLDFDTLTAPTPSRGRSLRNLTVNVFHPFELLPGAFDTGDFDWDPDLDESARLDCRTRQRSSPTLRTSTRLAGLAHGTRNDLPGRDPEVRSPRGQISYAT